MYTKDTFWDNTQGEFKVLQPGEFNDLVEKYKSDLGACNYNPTKTAFFIRYEDFAIRIASRWGEVGNDEERCNWTLNTPLNGYVAAIIWYDKLKHFKN